MVCKLKLWLPSPWVLSPHHAERKKGGKGKSTGIYREPTSHRQGIKCQLGRNYDESAVFTSKLWFNHNPLIYQERLQILHHWGASSEVQGFHTPTLQKGSPTLLRRHRITLKNIFSPEYSCSRFWLKWILGTRPRCTGFSQCKRKIFMLHSVFY